MSGTSRIVGSSKGVSLCHRSGTLGAGGANSGMPLAVSSGHDPQSKQCVSDVGSVWIHASRVYVQWF